MQEGIEKGGVSPCVNQCETKCSHTGTNQSPVRPKTSALMSICCPSVCTVHYAFRSILLWLSAMFVIENEDNIIHFICTHFVIQL